MFFRSDPTSDAKSVQVALLQCQQGTVQWLYPHGQIHLSIPTFAQSVGDNANDLRSISTTSYLENYFLLQEQFISVRICIKPQMGFSGAHVILSNGRKFLESEVQKIAYNRGMLCEDLPVKKDINRMYTFRLQTSSRTKHELEPHFELEEKIDRGRVSFEYFVAWS